MGDSAVVDGVAMVVAEVAKSGECGGEEERAVVCP